MSMTAFSWECVLELLGGGALGVPLTGTAKAGTLPGFLPPSEEDLKERTKVGDGEEKGEGRRERGGGRWLLLVLSSLHIPKSIALKTPPHSSTFT